MKTKFKTRFKKLIGILLLGFLLLFAFRLIYGYTKTVDDTASQSPFLENISSAKRNYASKKYEVKSSNTANATLQLDQKYEKIILLDILPS